MTEPVRLRCYYPGDIISGTTCRKHFGGHLGLQPVFQNYRHSRCHRVYVCDRKHHYCCHCHDRGSRAIPQLTERLNCFKSLKPGPRAKTQAAAPAMKQHAGVPKVKDDSRANAKQTAPAKTPAKAEQAAPTKTAAEPPKTDEAAPPKKGEAAPAKTETTTQSNAGEGLSPAQNDPATTSSIDRLSFAHEQPLCEGRDNLVAMIVAGLLTSDSSQALTPGCQAIPDDAKLELLERPPSVFPFMRVIKVKVTSPTQPDLTSGLTIEMGR
jgi:hypothetical protein